MDIKMNMTNKRCCKIHLPLVECKPYYYDTKSPFRAYKFMNPSFIWVYDSFDRYSLSSPR